MKVNSIQIKVVSVIVLVLSLSITGIFIFTTSNSRDNLVKAATDTLSINNDILNVFITNIMLSGTAPLASNTMESLRGLKQFEDISIYRTDGTIAFHDYKTLEYVNRYQSKIKFEKTPRLQLRTLKNDYFDKVLKTREPVRVELTDQQILEYYFPMFNYGKCNTCHGGQGEIRGIAHYKISISPIYDQINRAKTILIYLYSGTGIFIALLMILILRKLVVAPILRIGKVVALVGQGNLDTGVKLKGKDELAELGNQINDMINGLKERNRLMIENEIINVKNEENKKYLDNIQEGLLLINRDYIISDQYSNFLERLFKTSDIAGRTLTDFIYPDKSKFTVEREELEKFIKMIFHNTASDMDMIMEINPLNNKTIKLEEILGSDEKQGEIIVDVSFYRIMSGEDVENVMVLFEDRTEFVNVQKKLEYEKIKSESEIEHIAAILKAGPESYSDFIKETELALNQLKQNINKLKEKSESESVFRYVHKLKGTARYLEFMHISDVAHSIEQVVADIRDGKMSPDLGSTDKISEFIKIIENEIDDIRQLNERFIEFSGVHSQRSCSEEDEASYNSFVESLKKMTGELALQLNKKVNLNVEADPSYYRYLKKIKDTIIHLIRNAVDHGIEAEIERVSMNKPGTGNITLSVNADKDKQIAIRIADDGKGIDYEKIRKVAIKKNLIKEDSTDITKLKLLNILFAPGFSVKDNATDISGRGVGMDIVKHEITGLKGSISVSSYRDIGTKIILKLPREEKT